MNEQTTAVKLLHDDEEHAIIGGYGVIFGGEDLDGETFTPETDFDLDYVPVKRVFYDHTMNTEVRHALGSVVKVISDEAGLWIEAQLDKSKAYVEAVLKLVEQGVLGWSSGSIGHLVRKDGGVIKSWPIAEFSLTPTPAEPRTLGVERIKQLAQLDPSLEAFLPQVAGDATAKATAEDLQAVDIFEGIDLEDPIETIDPAGDEPATLPLEGKTMTDKTEEVQVEPVEAVQEPALDIEALKASILAELRETAPAKDGGYAVPNLKKVTKPGFANEPRLAFAHWVKTGDVGALKASNDTTMNITTDADGGYAVPTGHYNGIIARRDEGMLASKLGVRQIPGKGTTINVPLDGEADVAFASTAESNAFDRDAPAIGTKAMTLVKYTKKIDLTYELLEDEDSRLLAFLEDFVGRAMASHHNSLLLTEVASNGTALKTYASATAIAAGELEDMAGNVALSNYLDDSGSVAWVMRSSTFMDVMSITGNARLYADFNQGSFQRNLLGYPVEFSSSAAATAASAKDVYFGNWNYVGVRNAPEITMIRDPYTRAGYGEVILYYHYRTVYGVLQAEAIGYGAHPTG